MPHASCVSTSLQYHGLIFNDYNLKKKLQYRYIPQPDGTEKSEIEYADYNTMKWYVVSDGTCTEHDIKFPMPDPCVPPNATYTGQSVIGSVGHGQVRLNHYNLDWMDFRGYNIRIAVEAQTCDMVMETDYGNVDGAQAVYSYYFSDRTPFLKDPSILAMPQQCRHV